MKVRSLKRLKLKLQDKILFGSLQIPWNSNVPHFECLNTFSESQVGNAIVRSQQKKQTWQRLLLKRLIANETWRVRVYSVVWKLQVICDMVEFVLSNLTFSV